MVPVACKQIEVYVFRRRRGKVEFLLLRRSPSRSLAGVWQPVTGGIERGESVLAAAAREVLEETGMRPLRWWALEHMTVYYEPGRDRVSAVPTFAAEVAFTDTVHLSHEHDRYAFASPAQAARRVLWWTQRRSLRALHEELLAPGADASAREVTARMAGAPRGRKTRAVSRVPARRARASSRGRKRP
jgi:8-oxo-dGTP pyrophosphatase MutT (NUDIX family)